MEPQHHLGAAYVGGEATATLPIAGDASILVSSAVQVRCNLFRIFANVVGDPGSVVVDPSVWRIQNIIVGTESVLSALPPLPGTMFQQDATGQGYRLALPDVAQGTNFSVVFLVPRVGAITAATCRFGAMGHRCP